ncbi:MAG TPA: chitobiase/beta-hexosaminidase C-terminal domain-containing protein [Opitutus sp.]|nr:chitobiase/beta-hexosaminidase C-terminal domain-containing protein [Opitutus sp.]
MMTVLLSPAAKFRARRRCAALLFALVSIASALPARGQNLLTNGDFAAVDANGIPSNWTPENAALVAVDTTQFPAGETRSLRIATQDEGTSSLGYVLQSLNVAATGAPLVPDANYVARVWVRGTVNGLARLEVKRYNGSTELDRTDSTDATTDWSQVTMSFDTTGTTRVEVLLRYKKNASAAGQTAWFAGAELLPQAAAGSDARIGALTLVPTFESISAYVDYSGTYTAQTVELDYRVAGQADWRPALTPPAYPDDLQFRGSILRVQPNTNYEVRARLLLNGTVLDETTATTTTWTDDLPIAGEVLLPANSTGTYTISAQGSPTGWILYRAADGGSTVDVTGTNATEAVVLDHAAYVIVEGLTVRGGLQNGIRIDNSHDIRVRDCDVSGWSAPGTFTFVNQGDIDYGYIDAAGASINLRGGIRVGAGSTRVVVERNLIHHPVGKSPSWAFGHPNGPEGVILDTTGGNNVVRNNDILAADGHYFNDAIESVQNGSVNGGPYRDTDISGNLWQGANDDGMELDGGQMNVRVWHNWVEGGSASVSTAPNLKGSCYIFENVLVNGDERGGAQAGAIKMGGAPGVTFLLQNTIVTPGYGLTSGHYASLGAVSPLVSRNNLFTGLLPGEGRVRLDDAVSGDFDYDLIPVDGILPATFTTGPGREEHAVFGMPDFVAPEQRDFLLAGGSPGIAAGTPLANLTADGVTAPDLGAVDTSNQNESWPIRPASPETAPNRIVIRVRQGQPASASLVMVANAATGTTWAAHGGDAWLTVSPASGSTGDASQTLVCTVDSSGLGVGEHVTFASIRTSTGALRTVPVIVDVEPAQTLTFAREAESALPLGGFEAGSDPNASGGAYVQAVVLQPGQTNGEIGLDFDVPEAGTYFILARVRAAGPSNAVPTQDSVVLRVDGGEDLRWDLWGIGTEEWSWKRAYTVPATPTSDVIGKFTFSAGPHRIAVVARELGAQVDEIAVSNDPFLPASAPGPVPVIFTSALPDAVIGVAYSQTLLAGGEAPFTWSLAGGALPDGLMLSGDGTISGTPTTVGLGSFSVQVADANGDTATRAFDLTVALPPAAAPVFAPGGGTYTSVQHVAITSATDGATIRYTTDGSTPDGSHGTVYSGAIEIGATTTLKAVAYKSGLSDSAVTSADYVVNLPQTAAPVFSPAPGTYNSAQSIAITSATEGATIHYTTDGSAPSATNGMVYSGPVALPATATLQAVATAGGLLDSTVTSGTYAIGGTPAFQMSGGQVVMEAEHFASETGGAGQDWVVITQDGASGAATNNALQSLPNLGVGYAALDASLPHVDYLIDVPADAAGNYYVHIRDYGTSSTDDSVYVSIDDDTAVSQVVTAARTLDWKTSPGTLPLTAGLHTLTVWMREDGAVVDKIVVDTTSAAPTGLGPDESGAAGTPTVAAPAFSPAGGTFDSAQTVTITSATDGAAIRYTLDGTIPSATAGTVYSGPIDIAATATLKAIAYVADGGASAITSDTYTIQPAGGGGTGPFEMSGGQVVMEAENYTSQTADGAQSWVKITQDGASGAASDNALQALPNLGTANAALDPAAPRVEYEITVPDGAAGDYYVHIRDYGATSSDDSVYVSIDANTTVAAVVTAARTLDWKTSNIRLTLPAGAHTLTVWLREDGVVIDKIVVDGTSAAPTGFGPAESPREAAATPPAITTQPAAQTATVGDPVTFNVVATGDPAPAYQWQKDGTAIPDATGATLTLDHVTTADAGDYTVVVSNSAGSATSDGATLAVDKADAAVTFGATVFTYDGAPHPVDVTTTPAGLAVEIAYDGSATPPTLPGTYAVTATIADPDYAGSATGTLAIGITVLVRHAPTLNGTLDGSVQVLSGGSFALNGSANVTGDVLVPGTPTIRLNGSPAYAGSIDAAGAEAPAGYQITLNGGAALRHVVRRVDPLAMPAVDTPPVPTGGRDAVLNRAGDSAGDFATVRNLTLNGGVGAIAVPAGTYGNLTANGGSSFVLGVAGATEPAVYNLQALALNGGARVTIAGPVVLTLANGTALSGDAGAGGHPEWLTLRVASGGVTLNGGVTLTGHIVAPAGTVTINGGARIVGRVECDRLTLNGGSVHE